MAEPAARRVEVGAGGGAAAYRRTRALSISVEVRRQFSRRGIQLMLVAMAVLPCLLAGAVSAGKSGVAVNAQLLSDMATSSAANFAVFAIVAGSQFGLVLMVAYVMGEAVARDSQWLYLRVLLTVPVPRGQLLRRKFIACGIVCISGLLVFATVSVVIGLVFYGHGPLTPVSGAQVETSGLAWRLAAILVYIGVYLMWIGALAIFLSVLARDNPVAAVGGTVVVTLCSHLFGGLPTLQGLRAILPTRNYDAWLMLTRTDVDWFGMRWGLFLSLFYTGVFFLLAYVRFTTKDIAK
ncbi:ABC transporter permease [Antrihabitans sp. YC2-6]|uniref:ABC transporter permease n=1 Tax=Antrihabitans sp. YC2-6 TaxID=2799498 RepID=UPI0018F4744E|nr:ABC transporter permease subunit [Antrihabitans sp. YC2-6]MBJ8347625.1 ABC transporter permease subunit [Antrihabitans sp. YC2-6]